MNRNLSRRLLPLLLVLCLLLPLTAVSCGDEPTGDAVKLTFKSASGYDYLKTLNGKTVTINGYLATSSPADGSFIFLMNLPYQSCPFCVPNTSQLSNTMEVYPKKNRKFDYTTQAVKVTGTLRVAPKDQSFTDLYGYEFNFKIVDAEYTILREDEMAADLAVWQRLADSGLVTDIYAMYDYVNFLCKWDTYFVESYTDMDGNVQPGYYLYAADALNYLKNDGAQFNYGYKDGYFDGLVNRLNAVDASAFSDLSDNIRKAEALAARALSELENGNYTSEYGYVEKFGTEDTVYHLNAGAELSAEMDALYLWFSDWLGEWEM